MASQKKKVTLYFNSAMLAETQKEAVRQDRSISWIIQAAWKLARDEVKRMPGVVTPPNAVVNATGTVKAPPAPAPATQANGAPAGAVAGAALPR